MDSTGVLDENENDIINGLNEREKGEISLQLFKYIIDFMVKIPRDRQCTTGVAKRRSNTCGFFYLVNLCHNLK